MTEHDHNGMDALSGHGQMQESANPQTVLDKIAECCSHDFSINNITIQVEVASCEQKCD